MTRKHDISELLATHRVLTETPQIWLDVSRGSVTPEQAAKAMSGHESPALIERSVVLFAPPSAAQERAIRQRVLELAAPVRRARGAFVAGLVLASTLAAAFLLWVPLWPSAAEGYPPLSITYQVEMSAGWEPIRSGGGHDEPEEKPYRIDQQVDFTLRPSNSVDETELEVGLLAFDEQGRGQRLGAPRRLATTAGTMRWSERIDALGLTAGTWRLVFVVGRPGQLPTELEHGIEPPAADHYVVSSKTIRVMGYEGP